MEQNHEWAVTRRYMTLEAQAQPDHPETATPPPIAAACPEAGSSAEYKSGVHPPPQLHDGGILRNCDLVTQSN